MVNCKTCRYRIHLANLCDIHVDERDCDKAGTDFCLKKMNDPGFIEYMAQNPETKSENDTKCADFEVGGT